MPPLGRLEYLHVGTSDFDADLAYDRDTLGAELVWSFAGFGARGAGSPEGERFGIPDGPCLLFADRSGNHLAVFGNERPHILEASYRDPENPRAVRWRRGVAPARLRPRAGVGY